MDYAIGLGLDASESPRARKSLLALSLAANLGMLAAFKYADFFLGSLEALLASCGVRAPMPLLRLVLPVGISFYTFEAISYTVDVFRRRIRAGAATRRASSCSSPSSPPRGRADRPGARLPAAGPPGQAAIRN